MRGAAAEAVSERIVGPRGITLLGEITEEFAKDVGKIAHGARVYHSRGGQSASIAAASRKSRSVTPPASWLQSVSLTSL